MCRQLVDTKRRLMRVNALGLLFSVTGPKGPKDQVGVLRKGKLGKPIDTPFFPDPRSPVHMKGMVLFGITGGNGLAGAEEPLLVDGGLE